LSIVLSPLLFSISPNEHMKSEVNRDINSHNHGETNKYLKFFVAFDHNSSLETLERWSQSFDLFWQSSNSTFFVFAEKSSRIFSSCSSMIVSHWKRWLLTFSFRFSKEKWKKSKWIQIRKISQCSNPSSNFTSSC
jgi:hypothetical protein